MKVMQINSHYNSGGAGKIVAYLHRQLLAHGVESRVAYGRGNKVAEAGVTRIGSEAQNQLDAALTRVTGIAGFHSRAATRQLVRLLAAEKPDVLHLHGLHGYYLHYGILFDYINANNLPCVWTFHDCLAFTAQCGYPYDCNRYVNGCHDCPLKRDYPATYGPDFSVWMWKKKKALFTATENKIIVSPCEWMTGMARGSFMGKYPCVTVNNGIDTEGTFRYRGQSACREALGLDGDGKIALAVAYGAENPRKGVKFVLQAARDLPGITFVIIGCNEKLRAETAGMDNVIARGFTVDQEELARFYGAADVFLLPSLAENYATAAVEALACGTPVVGFHVGGIPEQAQDIFGETVPVGDQAAFEQALSAWCRRDTNKAAIAAVIREKNAMQVMFAQYYELYGSLCG